MNGHADEHPSGDLSPLLSLDDRAGPARRVSPEEARAMVLRAMSATETTDAVAASVGGPRRSLTFFTFAAVAALFVTTGAAAAIYLAVRAPTPPADPGPSRAVAPLGSENTPEVEDEPEGDADDAVEDEADEKASASKPARAAEDLLERASALRGDRRWREAERTYLRVKKTFPSTHAAYVATIAAASLRLEHLGDPSGALRLYHVARQHAPNGALDADVLFGISGAQRALDDREGERRALEELIELHPSSVFAASARRRIAELEARVP